MLSPLLNRGTRTNAATIRTCSTMDATSARRLILRARLSNSESPSTKQPPRKFACSCGPGLWAITHLRKNGPARRGFGGADSPEVVFGEPAPLSQGCEVRASSAPFDTAERDKFPRSDQKTLEARDTGIFEKCPVLRGNRSLCEHLLIGGAHPIVRTWIRRRFKWTGIFPKPWAYAARAGLHWTAIRRRIL